jgi:WD40 repeat protein
MNQKKVVLRVAFAVAAFSISAGISVKARADENAAPVPPAPALELKHPARVEVIALSPNGKNLASLTNEPGANRTTPVLRVWSLETGQVSKSWDVLKWELANGVIKSMAFSPDGKILATGGKGFISFWNTDGQQQKTFKGHTGNVESLTFSPDGKVLASAGVQKAGGNPQSELLLWNMATGTKRELPVEMPERSSFMTVAPTLRFSFDGSLLVAPQSHFVVGIWDTTTLQRLKSMTDKSVRGVITAVAISPDKKTVATGHTGHNLRLWDAQSGQPQAVLLDVKPNWDGNGPSGGVNGLAFKADGKGLVSAGANQEGGGGEGELLVWAWPDWQKKLSLIPPGTDGIRLFDTSADGKTVATVETLDGTIKVWRIP